MTASRKIALLAGVLAIASFGIASAQTPDTRIIVHGAINAPAHMQPVTDGRDDATPEIAVVYDTQVQNTPAAQPVSTRATDANQTPDQPASAGGRTNLNQAVKSQ